jgi:acetolactate synthase regulatory subunit
VSLTLTSMRSPDVLARQIARLYDVVSVTLEPRQDLE